MAFRHVSVDEATYQILEEYRKSIGAKSVAKSVAVLAKGWKNRQEGTFAE